MIFYSPYACKSSGGFCNVFVVLCSTLKLLVSYNVSISKYDTRTIAMLEKLLGVGNFSGFISHSTHHQAIFPTFFSKFSFPFMVQIIALAFLGCWALIILTLVICLQQDDHHIILDAITHVETNNSLFDISL